MMHAKPRSDLVPYTFIWESENYYYFWETVAALGLKVG